MLNFSNRQTTLDLNGPVLSIVQQPTSVSLCNVGIATFVGIATATFPTQTPANNPTNTGILTQRWYADGYGPLSDGSITELGITVAGSGSTTLTISDAISPTANGLSFFMRPDYIPSAYSQPVGSAVVAGTARSTGNGNNASLTDSSVATLTVFPKVTITKLPVSASVAQFTSATFEVVAELSDTTQGNLSYQWAANGVELSDGINLVPTLASFTELTTSNVVLGTPGFNGSGIYLDLSSFSGTVPVTFNTSESSLVVHYINIPGVGTIPETTKEITYYLAGGSIYGPCSVGYGNLYIGSETPVGGTTTLVVEEGGDDWNDMILTTNTGFFARIATDPGITGTVLESETTQVLTNAEDTVSGSKTNKLTISSNLVGTQTITCIITHPVSCSTPIIIDEVEFDSISARQIINFEGNPSSAYDPGANFSSSLSSVNLFDFGQDGTTVPLGGQIITFYAAERDVYVEMDIHASSGANYGSYSGGKGGYSRVRFTMKQNEEYAIAGYNFGNTAFIYRKSQLMLVVGSGGNAGPNGNGGAGGGVTEAGADGRGSGGGKGGALSSPGSNGTFGSLSASVPLKSGDSAASFPNGGIVITCPKGYWTRVGYSPCDDIGIQQYYDAAGNRVTNTAFIDRGFKAGYGIRNTAGAGDYSANGGYGCTGGAGGVSGGGGGGGSGYTDGSIEVIESIQGGSQYNSATLIIRAVSEKTATQTVTDTQGSISVGSPFTVTRVTDPGITGTEGHPLGSIRYIVDISDYVNPTLSVRVLDASLRASGLIDSDNSIVVTSGYPKQLSSNSYEIAFDMNNSQGPGRQATFVRSFSLTVVGT